MDQDTPATEIKKKDLDANSEALRNLLKYIPDSPPIRSIVDIRYGLGGWAKVALQRFPSANVFGFEQDRDTLMAAWADGRVVVSAARFGVDSSLPKRRDILLADFNTTTRLKRELLDEALEIVRPRYVVFTDVACSKLHLNYRSYGLDRPSLTRYWKKFPIDGYRFVAYSKVHHAASTGLFRRLK